MPDEMTELTLQTTEGGMPIANLLKAAGLVDSTSEALRMVQQGAVKIDGERVGDKRLLMPSGSTAIYQVGKRRFAKVTLV